MKNKNVSKIGRVVPPLSFSASAMTKPKILNPLQEWQLKYEDRIVFSNYDKQWITPWKIYTRIDGFLWLFVRLPIRLIRGKYFLFTADARDAQGIVTFIVSKLLRKPIMLSDTFFIRSDSLLARIVWPINRFIASRAILLSVPSQRGKIFWRSVGVSESKLRIVHIFVSMVEANSGNVNSAKEIKEKLGYKKIVLFVGRLIKEKGIEYLIEAFAKLSKENKEVGLVIVGDGPERNRLETLCNSMKIDKVTFAGFIDREDITPYYLLSDILVLPAPKGKIHEEWGLVVNEAMSVGKPVIVSESVGCAYELVKHCVNGFIIPDKNVEALYDALRKLINNEELLYRMGEESKKTIAEGFTYQHAIESKKDMIEEAIRRQIS